MIYHNWRKINFFAPDIQAMRCGNCHSTHYASVWDETYVCPQCGHVVEHLVEVHENSWSIVQSSVKVGETPKCVYLFATRLRGRVIGGKIAVVTEEAKCFFVPETGRVYLQSPSKRPYGWRSSWKQRSPLLDISWYDFDSVPTGMMLNSIIQNNPDARIALFELISARQNGANLLKERGLKIYSLRDLANIVRLSHATPCTFRKLAELRKVYGAEIGRLKPSDRNIEQSLANIVGMRTKSTKRAAEGSLRAVLNFKWIRQCVSLPDNQVKWLEFFRNMEDSCYNPTRHRLAQIVKLVRKGSHVAGETVFTNKFVKTASQEALILLADSATMFAGINGRIPIDFTGTAQEIHDRLVLAYNELKTMNRPIAYGQGEKAKETSIKSYSFKMATSSDELVTIGNQMSICVGSYADRAVDKKVSIFSVKEECTEKYVACLEVAEGCLVQAKMPHNIRPTGAVKDAIVQWAAQSNTPVRTTDI